MPMSLVGFLHIQFDKMNDLEPHPIFYSLVEQVVIGVFSSDVIRVQFMKGPFTYSN